MKYSIDTSAILDGWVRYYPPDIFPSLWKKLDGLIKEGQLRATEEVLVELERKLDEVYQWVRMRKDLFIPIDSQIQLVVADILKDHPGLVGQRKTRSTADAFVIALARIERCTVVTGERATNSLKRPHIPDVCAVLGIRCINLLQLMREQGWVFQS